VKQVSVEHPTPAARRAETTPARQDDLWPEDPAHLEAPSPHLPHEHDESSHSQASATPQHRPIGEKAYEDTTSEREDTDKGPVMDDVYHRLVVTERAKAARRR
jgi:hypothetical protein